MNKDQQTKSLSIFSRHKLSRSNTLVDVSVDSTSKGTEASSRELKFKEPVFTEIRANSAIHSLNFVSLHRQYKSSPGQRLGPEKSMKDEQAMENKYLNSISRLNEEIQIMSHQLELAYEQINDLTMQINEQNHKHSVQVQRILEKHRKKVEKLQKNENLLELKAKNEQLQRTLMEKEVEIQEQQRKFNENIAYVTQQYEKKLKFKESEHVFKVGNLKNQFVDVIEELKTKFFDQIYALHEKERTESEQVKEKLKGIEAKEGLESESTALDVDQERNQKHLDSVADLQVVEELSFHQNISINALELSVEASNDFDKSLRQLINQISFDDDVSMSELLNK